MTELIMAVVALVLPSTAPCAALAALDVVRSAAWAAGDERLLAAVYVPPAERDDVAELRRWRDRAIGVDGVRMVRAECHAESAASVSVVERLTSATAVLSDGQRLRLPDGGWRRRTMELERHQGWWRIARVQ